MSLLHVDLIHGLRPHPLSGTSYGLKRVTTEARRRSDQGLINELDQGRLYDSQLPPPN